MASFPSLKTGAVTQYPSQKTLAFATDVIRFIDGKEQRSRCYKRPLRNWVISIHAVDEGELAVLDQFFRDQSGSEGTFSFTDPWDGVVYPNCSLASDDIHVQLNGPGGGQTRLVIQENRS